MSLSQKKQIIKFFTVSGKVLVALGSIPVNGGTSNIELIDLISNASVCPILSAFPAGGSTIFGGLIPEGIVLICTNSFCCTSTNGLSWTTISNMKTMRQSAAATSAPYPYSSIIVTGGLAGTMSLISKRKCHT